MGRGKYNKQVHDKIITLAEKGYINKEICKSVGISEATLYGWTDPKSEKNFKLELAESLKKAKQVIDDKVEQKLFKRAMGYRYNEVTKELVKNEDGFSELKVTKVVTKEVVPEVSAQIFWLKNRQPDKWRDVKTLNNNATIEKDKNLLGELLGKED
jgi:transposase